MQDPKNQGEPRAAFSQSPLTHSCSVTDYSQYARDVQSPAESAKA